MLALRDKETQKRGMVLIISSDDFHGEKFEVTWFERAINGMNKLFVGLPGSMQGVHFCHYYTNDDNNTSTAAETASIAHFMNLSVKTANERSKTRIRLHTGMCFLFCSFCCSYLR